MKTQTFHFRFGILFLMVVLAAFSRLIPHPPNFAPIGAMALFGAAYFSKKITALIYPIFAMWLSDLFLNNVVYGQYFDHFVWFYQGYYWTYGAFIAIGLLGFVLLKKVKPQSVLLGALSASILFFILSNFGVWASGTMYPKDVNGLVACYTAAIPFFKITLMGNLVYSGVMFGAFEYAQAKIPALKPV